jgi:hypothetical protein
LEIGTRGKQADKWKNPVSDVSKSFNYLMESAGKMNSDFLKCLIESNTITSVDKCLRNIIKSVEKIECQKIKKKVAICSKYKKIKPSVLNCMILAKTPKAVKKCIGVKLTTL